MARQARQDKPTQRIVYVPAHMLALVDLMHLDPLTGKPKYGSFSRYIERLIRDDLTKRGML